jgi:hypothetical protein
MRSTTPIRRHLGVVFRKLGRHVEIKIKGGGTNGPRDGRLHVGWRGTENTGLSAALVEEWLWARTSRVPFARDRRPVPNLD